jgi:hypothetical protein
VRRGLGEDRPDSDVDLIVDLPPHMGLRRANHVALSFDRLRAEAESRASSRDLIRKVAEEQWT